MLEGQRTAIKLSSSASGKAPDGAGPPLTIPPRPLAQTYPPFAGVAYCLRHPLHQGLLLELGCFEGAEKRIG